MSVRGASLLLALTVFGCRASVEIGPLPLPTAGYGSAIAADFLVLGPDKWKAERGVLRDALNEHLKGQGFQDSEAQIRIWGIVTQLDHSGLEVVLVCTDARTGRLIWSGRSLQGPGYVGKTESVAKDNRFGAELSSMLIVSGLVDAGVLTEIK